MVTKDTLFNDLPRDIKQKIINIRNMGNMQFSALAQQPINELSHIIIPSEKQIRATFLELCEASQNMQPVNAEAKLEEELAKFKKFSETYRSTLDSRNFIAELDKTVQLMEAKYNQSK